MVYKIIECYCIDWKGYFFLCWKPFTREQAKEDRRIDHLPFMKMEIVEKRNLVIIIQ